MNYYEPMGFYDDGYGETFFPVVFGGGGFYNSKRKEICILD